MKSMRIDYDRDYGISCRTGWSVAIDGHYYVQFYRCLLLALVVAAWKHLTHVLVRSTRAQSN